MLIPGLVLLLLAPAGGEEVRLRSEKGQEAKGLVRQVFQKTGLPVLYAPEGLAGKAIRGSYDVSFPRENAGDFLVFALSTCSLEVRRYPGPQPLAVVVPPSALRTDFRCTGLETPLRFNRGPGAWTAEADRTDSLSQESVEGLLAALEGGERPTRRLALALLSQFGPRSPEVVRAIGATLRDDALAPVAVWALERAGYFAKPALPALREYAERTHAPDDGRARRAIRAIERAYHPDLLAPARASLRAPDSFLVEFETTKGTFRVEVTRALSPNGADRFYNLVKLGYYDDTAFFRVIPGFVAQFGLHDEHAVNRAWRNATIEDDPVKTPNTRGTLSFAKQDEDSRTTQVFVNLADRNKALDAQGFSPFGRVVAGMDVVDRLYDGYGETSNRQGRIHFDGNAFLKREFPKLDYIEKARIVR